MARYIQSPQAVADIYEIAEYIAKESPKSAERWIDEVTQLFNLLASQPFLGQKYFSPRLGEVRRHSHGNYLFYYRPLTECIEIVRVLHGARQQDKLI